jgi:hypothetical protein
MKAFGRNRNPLINWLRRRLVPAPGEAVWLDDDRWVTFLGTSVAEQEETCVRCERPIARGEEMTVVNIDEEDGAVLLGWPLCAACRAQIEQHGMRVDTPGDCA